MTESWPGWPKGFNKSIEYVDEDGELMDFKLAAKDAPHHLRVMRQLYLSNRACKAATKQWKIDNGEEDAQSEDESGEIHAPAPSLPAARQPSTATIASARKQPPKSGRKSTASTPTKGPATKKSAEPSNKPRRPYTLKEPISSGGSSAANLLARLELMARYRVPEEHVSYTPTALPTLTQRTGGTLSKPQPEQTAAQDELHQETPAVPANTKVSTADQGYILFDSEDDSDEESQTGNQRACPLPIPASTTDNQVDRADDDDDSLFGGDPDESSDEGTNSGSGAGNGERQSSPSTSLSEHDTQQEPIPETADNEPAMDLGDDLQAAFGRYFEQEDQEGTTHAASLSGYGGETDDEPHVANEVKARLEAELKSKLAEERREKQRARKKLTPEEREIVKEADKKAKKIETDKRRAEKEAEKKAKAEQKKEQKAKDREAKEARDKEQKEANAQEAQRRREEKKAAHDALSPKEKKEKKELLQEARAKTFESKYGPTVIPSEEIVRAATSLLHDKQAHPDRYKSRVLSLQASAAEDQDVDDSSYLPRDYRRYAKWRLGPDYGILARHLDLETETPVKDLWASIEVDETLGQSINEYLDLVHETPGCKIRIDGEPTEADKRLLAERAHDLLLHCEWGPKLFSSPMFRPLPPGDYLPSWRTSSTRILLVVAKLIYKIVQKRTKSKRQWSQPSSVVEAPIVEAPVVRAPFVWAPVVTSNPIQPVKPVKPAKGRGAEAPRQAQAHAQAQANARAQVNARAQANAHAQAHARAQAHAPAAPAAQHIQPTSAVSARPILMRVPQPLTAFVPAPQDLSPAAFGQPAARWEHVVQPGTVFGHGVPATNQHRAAPWGPLAGEQNQVPFQAPQPSHRPERRPADENRIMAASGPNKRPRLDTAAFPLPNHQHMEGGIAPFQNRPARADLRYPTPTSLSPEPAPRPQYHFAPGPPQVPQATVSESDLRRAGIHPLQLGPRLHAQRRTLDQSQAAEQARFLQQYPEIQALRSKPHLSREELQLMLHSTDFLLGMAQQRLALHDSQQMERTGRVNIDVWDNLEVCEHLCLFNIDCQTDIAKLNEQKNALSLRLAALGDPSVSRV